MESRKTVTEKILFKVGKNIKVNTYNIDLSWKDIIETEGILPTDIYGGVNFYDEKESGAFSMKMPDELETFSVPYITVFRTRPENDDEFFERMKYEEKYRNSTEEKEKLEYFRLKAKFEPEQ